LENEDELKEMEEEKDAKQMNAGQTENKARKKEERVMKKEEQEVFDQEMEREREREFHPICWTHFKQEPRRETPEIDSKDDLALMQENEEAPSESYLGERLPDRV
jgi:hypothetical protein